MSAIEIGNAPCSWGVLEFDHTAEPMGYAQVLDELASAGFRGTELGDWGFMPTTPDALSEALESHDLQMIAAFVPVALADPQAVRAGIEVATRTARLLAEVGPAPLIVLSDDNGTVAERTRCAGRITKEAGLDASTWDRYAAGAEDIARAVLDESGARTVFHHHCAGWVETPEETLALMERTDPDLLGLCLDTGHWTFGGGNPLAALERFGERIWHVHFKDCHPEIAQITQEQDLDYFQAVQAGLFCELGEGAVDFNAITQQLMRQDYSGWIVVEQDVLPGMGSPLESAVRNRRFLEELGL